MNKKPKISLRKLGRPRKEPTIEEQQEVFTVSPEHKYEQHILKLQTMQGFYDEYISRLGYTSSNAEAYETTEVFFEAYFGKRRFKNYDSFRARMSQFQSEKK